MFFQRGIARPETGEISSLSCEPQPGEAIVVSVFDVSGQLTAMQVQQLIITAYTWAIPQASAYASICCVIEVEPLNLMSQTRPAFTGVSEAGT